jgi:hypothetical protein
VPNVIDTCALAFGIRAADTSNAAAITKLFTPRIRFVSRIVAMAETLLDTVVPEFGFSCMSTEAPLTDGSKGRIACHIRLGNIHLSTSVANLTTFIPIERSAGGRP